MTLLQRSLAAATLAASSLASNHDLFQSMVEVQNTKQTYSPPDRKLSVTNAVGTETCEEIHAKASWGPLRLGYELIGAEAVPNDIAEFVRDTLMVKATAYWTSVLQVRQATQPLKMSRLGLQGSKFPFDTEVHFKSSQAPTCGEVTVPDRYLKAFRTCQDRCHVPGSCSGACISNGACACDTDAWMQQGDSYCALSRQSKTRIALRAAPSTPVR